MIDRQESLEAAKRDRQNNELQARVLQQFVAGVEITVVAPGSMQYIARKRG